MNLKTVLRGLEERVEALAETADNKKARLALHAAATNLMLARWEYEDGPAADVTDEVLTLAQAAELLGTTRRWVREHSKELGGRRIGRKFLYNRRRLLEGRAEAKEVKVA